MPAVKAKAKEAPFEYSKAFQSRILRVLYSDPDFTATTAIHLSPRHFEHRAHRWLAEKLIGYTRQHGTGASRDYLDIELARDRKLGRLTADDALAAQAVVSRLKRPVKDRSFIKAELFKFIKNQVTRQVLLASLDHLEAHDFDAIDSEFQKALDVQNSLSGGLGVSYVKDIVARTKRRRKYVPNGVSTGLRLDDYLKPAGLPPKALGVILAPTGVGKTHALVHLGKSAVVESGVKVLHITLELSDEMTVDRYDTAFTNIGMSKLESERLKVRRAVRGLGRQFGDFLIVKEFPPATLTAAAARAFIRQLERIAFYPGMVIVDYGDLMLPSVIRRRDSSTYEEMGDVYQELRKLSYDVGAPVWTASQTNRSALNKEHFEIDSTSDSFKKIMVADLVVALCQTKKEKAARLARAYTAKSRFGPDKFELPIRIDTRKSLLTDA